MDQRRSEKWQIKFNEDKCEVLHFGRSTVREKFVVIGRSLDSIDVQRRLMGGLCPWQHKFNGLMVQSCFTLMEW